MREAESVCIVNLEREEAIQVVLEQVYLCYIQVLLFELAMVSVVAISLFVALVVTIRKPNKEKHTSAR